MLSYYDSNMLFWSIHDTIGNSTSIDNVENFAQKSCTWYDTCSYTNAWINNMPAHKDGRWTFLSPDINSYRGQGQQKATLHCQIYLRMSFPDSFIFCMLLLTRI